MKFKNLIDLNTGEMVEIKLDKSLELKVKEGVKQANRAGKRAARKLLKLLSA